MGQTPPLESVPSGAAWEGLGWGRRQEGREGGAGPLSTALVLVGGRGGCGASQAACSQSREQSVLPWRWPGLGPRPPGPWPLSCRCCCSWLRPSPSWVVSWGTTLGWWWGRGTGPGLSPSSMDTPGLCGVCVLDLGGLRGGLGAFMKGPWIGALRPGSGVGTGKPRAEAGSRGLQVVGVSSPSLW